jgi:hypothetical protein
MPMRLIVDLQIGLGKSKFPENSGHFASGDVRLDWLEVRFGEATDYGPKVLFWVILATTFITVRCDGLAKSGRGFPWWTGQLAKNPD